jgi:hypothetical protein
MKININQKRITLQKEEGFGRPRKKEKNKNGSKKSSSKEVIPKSNEKEAVESKHKIR